MSSKLGLGGADERRAFTKSSLISVPAADQTNGPTARSSSGELASLLLSVFPMRQPPGSLRFISCNGSPKQTL